MPMLAEQGEDFPIFPCVLSREIPDRVLSPTMANPQLPSFSPQSSARSSRSTRSPVFDALMMAASPRRIHGRRELPTCPPGPASDEGLQNRSVAFVKRAFAWFASGCCAACRAAAARSQAHQHDAADLRARVGVDAAGCRAPTERDPARLRKSVTNS
jgi:hypothetical protein